MSEPEHPDEAVAAATRGLPTSMLNGVGPNGLSYVLAINEYCQRHFRADVRYVFARCDPGYSATAVLDGLIYATGKDPNKHVAKILAAKSTAQVLMPEMRDQAADERLPEAFKLAIFDNVDLADERIPEMTMPYDSVKPYKILLRCLDRNFGYHESDVQLTTHSPDSDYCPARLSLTVGSYSVSVPLTRLAKQEAAQTILMNVHPHLESWGSLVRMYAVNTARNFEDMTMLAGIQNIALHPIDADAEDGVAAAEDKGEPRTAFRGGEEDDDDDDSEESGDDSEEDEDDEDGDDEEEEEEDEDEDEEEDAGPRDCRDRCVVELGDSDEDEDDLADRGAAVGTVGTSHQQRDGARVKPERDVNFNLNLPADTPQPPQQHAFHGRLSFGDLPTIGEDFDAVLLEPLRVATATATATRTSQRPLQVAQATAATASEAPPLADLARADGHPGPGDAGRTQRRRRGPGPGPRSAAWPALPEWGGVLEAAEEAVEEHGQVQDGPPLLWCDMPSSFADIFKDWPHRRRQGDAQDDAQDRDRGAVLSAFFGLEIDGEEGEAEEGH